MNGLTKLLRSIAADANEQRRKNKMKRTRTRKQPDEPPAQEEKKEPAGKKQSLSKWLQGKLLEDLDRNRNALRDEAIKEFGKTKTIMNHFRTFTGNQLAFLKAKGLVAADYHAPRKSAERKGFYRPTSTPVEKVSKFNDASTPAEKARILAKAREIKAQGGRLSKKPISRVRKTKTPKPKLKVTRTRTRVKKKGK